IKGARFAEDFGPVDPACACWCCRNYTAAYVRHLYRSHEMLAARLLTYHNLYFYARLMEGARAAIAGDRFVEFRREFLATYGSGAPGGVGARPRPGGPRGEGGGRGGGPEGRRFPAGMGSPGGASRRPEAAGGRSGPPAGGGPGGGGGPETARTREGVIAFSGT